MRYVVKRASAEPRLDVDLGREPWALAEVAQVDSFHAKSSDHRPETRARVLFHGRSLFVSFTVRDKYVLARQREFQSPVYTDSCVEFFFRPKPEKGYFNLEMNCLGVILMYYFTDVEQRGAAPEEYVKVDPMLAATIEVFHTMRDGTELEIAEDLDWQLCYKLPIAVLEHYSGEIGELSGQSWTGNFFKCADNSSHPHWASWSPIGESLNFHQPLHFGQIEFRDS